MFSSQLCSPDTPLFTKSPFQNNENAKQTYNEDLEKEESQKRKPIENELTEQDLMEV